VHHNPTPLLFLLEQAPGTRDDAGQRYLVVTFSRVKRLNHTPALDTSRFIIICIVFLVQPWIETSQMKNMPAWI
jgi:hypothetical protein